MSKYRKFIVALVGLVVVAADTFWGFSISAGVQEQAINLIVMALTAVGVYAVSNEQP